MKDKENLHRIERNINLLTPTAKGARLHPDNELEIIQQTLELVRGIISNMEDKS
jgi:hypothetical protein